MDAILLAAWWLGIGRIRDQTDRLASGSLALGSGIQPPLPVRLVVKPTCIGG
jgi:hypothetical protein